VSRAPSNFRQSDVTKAINAAKASGLPIARIEVEPKTAKITVIIGEPKENEATPEPNPWHGARVVLPKRQKRKDA
jgi:hypothetical protein